MLDSAARIHELLTEAGAAPRPESAQSPGSPEGAGDPGGPVGPGLTAERAEELIAHIRAGRDAR